MYVFNIFLCNYTPCTSWWYNVGVITRIEARGTLISFACHFWSNFLEKLLVWRGNDLMMIGYFMEFSWCRYAMCRMFVSLTNRKKYISSNGSRAGFEPTSYDFRSHTPTYWAIGVYSQIWQMPYISYTLFCFPFLSTSP